MYVTDYIYNSDNKHKCIVERYTDHLINNSNKIVLFEAQYPQQQYDLRFDPNVDPNVDPNADPNSVELPIQFERLKQYVLYNKLKNIKQFLVNLDDIDRTNSEVTNLLEFLDMILLFYNTFTYKDIVGLIDILVETISDKLKVKLPSRLENI